MVQKPTGHAAQDEPSERTRPSGADHDRSCILLIGDSREAMPCSPLRSHDILGSLAHLHCLTAQPLCNSEPRSFVCDVEVPGVDDKGRTAREERRRNGDRVSCLS